MGCIDSVLAVRTIQQLLVLYWKNALVAWRNRRATLLRLIAPFFFLLLALLIDKAIQADSSNEAAFSTVTNPKPQYINAIPQCSEDVYIGDAFCIEVVYTPSPNPATDAIMAAVKANNPKPITVEGMASRQAVQQYLFANPNTVLAAVHFELDNTTAAAGGGLAGFILQTNTTVKYFKGSFQDLNLFMQLPLQAAVQREIARYQMRVSLGDSTASVDSMDFSFAMKEFAHPTIATNSVLGQVLGPFIFAACMFSFVVQIAAVVGEKEMGLKQALRTMGMTDAAYWLSWALWEVTLAFVVANSICIYGLILQFDLFLENNYGLLFFLFFLFQLSMSSLALTLAAFISRTQIAVYIGFSIFILGWVMQTVVIFGVPYTPDFYKDAGGAITVIFSLLPWDLLAKGLMDLGKATVGANPGLDWDQRSSYCKNIPVVADQPPYNPREEFRDYECVVPLNSLYWIMVILWLGYLALAVYLDNVLPNEHGVRKPLWYLFDPNYWCPGSCGRQANPLKHLQHEQAHSHTARTAPNGIGNGAANGAGAVAGAPVDPDVAAEKDKMQALLQHRTGAGPGAMASQEVGGPEAAAGRGRRNAVEVYGLTKMYAGSCGCCGSSVECCAAFECCSCEATEPFWAIKGSWFAIEEGSLFCLLGPNGAGKTTTINCLTGVVPPTSGEALVYEEAISSVGGLQRIRAHMGVCPQFDVLWPELNGREHLIIYGHVKGLPRGKVGFETSELLERVKLTYAGGQRTSAYSGGMKRRLSVACALLGDPRIVYLDEPTTGMDPISRRYVWDIIQEAKQGRAIVLTTHSMEEADILGDRIAIMARGALRCIGTSLRLKQRFGAGYRLSVSVLAAPHRAAPNGAGAGDSAAGPPAAASAGGGGGGGSSYYTPDELTAAAQRMERIKAMVMAQLGVAPSEESRAYTCWLVGRDREQALIAFLKQLEAGREQLGVTDVHLSLTSLEEVFLNIARLAELEAAAERGQPDVEHVLEDGSSLRIPVGSEVVAHPSNGMVYKVRWGTDEAGRLTIAQVTPAPDALAGPPALGLPAGAAPSSAYMPVAAPVMAYYPASGISPSPDLAAGHHGAARQGTAMSSTEAPNGEDGLLASPGSGQPRPMGQSYNGSGAYPPGYAPSPLMSQAMDPPPAHPGSMTR